jgi:uncharacterized protein (TIGR00251 family)
MDHEKQLSKLAVRDTPLGAVVSVKAVPGSSRDKIAGVLGDCLKIATSAPPEKGKANAAIAAILAKALGVHRRAVELVGGPTNPRKEFRVAGLTADQVRQRLAKP